MQRLPRPRHVWRVRTTSELSSSHESPGQRNKYRGTVLPHTDLPICRSPEETTSTELPLQEVRTGGEGRGKGHRYKGIRQGTQGQALQGHMYGRAADGYRDCWGELGRAGTSGGTRTGGMQYLCTIIYILCSLHVGTVSEGCNNLIII